MLIGFWARRTVHGVVLIMRHCSRAFTLVAKWGFTGLNHFLRPGAWQIVLIFNTVMYVTPVPYISLERVKYTIIAMSDIWLYDLMHMSIGITHEIFKFYFNLSSGIDFNIILILILGVLYANFPWSCLFILTNISKWFEKDKNHSDERVHEERCTAQVSTHCGRGKWSTRISLKYD